jgi:hypothetical protein
VETRTIRYIFQIVDGPTRTFQVQLDPRTLFPAQPLPDDLPEWTRLEFHQCSNCPLSPAGSPHCPAAARLVDLVDAFSDIKSTAQARIRVETPERAVFKETTAARGIASLMGLKMATSECPILGKLRPQTQVHVPFASETETLFRSLSVYLMAQLLRAQRREVVDWSLAGIREIYQAINVVNSAFSKRLRAGLTLDANANALVHLDLFAKSVGAEIGDFLERVAPSFCDWLGPVEALEAESLEEAQQVRPAKRRPATG